MKSSGTFTLNAIATGAKMEVMFSPTFINPSKGMQRSRFCSPIPGDLFNIAKR